MQYLLYKCNYSESQATDTPATSSFVFWYWHVMLCVTCHVIGGGGNKKCFAFAFLLSLLSVTEGIITLMTIVNQSFSNRFKGADFLFSWGS